jgi:DNA primase
LIRTSGAPAFEQLLRVARPLADVLWRSELDARAIDTPERRADLERRVMAQAEKIADRVVQGEYRRFLRDRLFTLGRPPRGGAPMRRGTSVGGGIIKAPLPSWGSGRSDTPPPPPTPGRRQRELLIGMLLEHPFLVVEAHEDIAALDFPEPELDRLRRAILEVEVLSPGLDAEELRQHLGQNGFAMTVDAVISALADHAGFLLRVSAADIVRQSWTHVTRMVREGDRSELADAADALSRDLSPETWERFLALQGREAQEGFSEDEFPPGRVEGIASR